MQHSVAKRMLDQFWHPSSIYPSLNQTGLVCNVWITVGPNELAIRLQILCQEQTKMKLDDLM